MFNRKLKERVSELENQMARLQLDKWLKENGMEKCSVNARQRYVVCLECYYQQITEEFTTVQNLFDELTSKEDYYKFKYDKIAKIEEECMQAKINYLVGYKNKKVGRPRKAVNK